VISKALYLFMFCVTASATAQSNIPAPTGPGTIAGEVLTYQGKPAAGCLVDVIGTSHSSTARQRILANADGSFQAKNLSLGEYVVVPFLQDADGRYMGGATTFYSPHPYRVALTEAASSQHTTLYLGPPNRIFSGVITSTNGSPIPAVIQIEYINDPDRFVRFSASNSGAYRVLIPANTRLKITIAAPNYATLSTTVAPVDENTDPQADYKLAPLN